MSGIVPKQNALKFKIAPHKQKSTVKMFLAGRYEVPLANEALCLSTPKHNGKSGTGSVYVSQMTFHIDVKSRGSPCYSCTLGSSKSIVSETKIPLQHHVFNGTRFNGKGL
jgi:hypothetical protein